jgi:dCMP deaminase
MHPGYNGTPAGWDNNCEDVQWCTGGGWLSPEEIDEGWPYKGTYLDANGYEMQGQYRLKTKPEVLHAEPNALAKMLKAGMSTKDADVFVTHAPCIDCAKILSQAGVRSVTYGEAYRDNSGIDFLVKSGVVVEKFMD